MYDINIWSVIVSAISAIIISSLWYSPILFGNKWISLAGFKEKDIEEAKQKGVSAMWKQYTGQLIVSFVSMLVLAFAISTSKVSGVLDGAFVGAIIWLGFVLTIHIQEMLWLRKNITMNLIDTGNALFCLMVGGMIMGAW